MPFSTTFSRVKSFANNGSLLPGDLNSQLDDIGNQLASNNVQSGINDAAAIRRAKFTQLASGSRTNVAFGALSNGPDQVTNIVLPADGLIFVAYNCSIQNSNGGAGQAAIFIGANELKRIGTVTAGPIVQESISLPSAGVAYAAYTGNVGLQNDSNSGYVGESLTGQVSDAVGIFVAAGTYTISVQFKASSGSITASQRRMRVWTETFG